MQSIIIFVALRIQSHDTNILLKENPLPEKLKMSMSTVPEMQSLDFDPKYIFAIIILQYLDIAGQNNYIEIMEILNIMTIYITKSL